MKLTMKMNMKMNTKMNNKTSLLLALLGTAATTTITITITTIFSSLSFANALPQRTIVGGVESEPHEFPYFIHLEGDCSCGGALIAPDLVLSAAHCFGWGCSKNQVPIHVGAQERGQLTGNAQKRMIKKVIKHPGYGGAFSTRFDYALAVLDTPVTIDESKFKLELNHDDNFPSDGAELIAMGFGTLSQNSDKSAKFLRNVTLPCISNEECSEYYKGKEKIGDEMVCAIVDGGGKDTCYGDSGGPLVERTYNEDDGTFVDIHVGIVSWGYGCAKAKYPGVYARTSNQIDWIKSTACDDLNSVAAFCRPPTKAPTTGTLTKAPSTVVIPTVAPANAPLRPTELPTTKAPTNARPTKRPTKSKASKKQGKKNAKRDRANTGTELGSELVVTAKDTQQVFQTEQKNCYCVPFLYDEDRTIYVGNLPLTITRKALAALFRDCGPIASSRIRSVPVTGIKLPKEQAGNQNMMRKVCVNTNQIDTTATDRVHGYVVFKHGGDVEKALALNNRLEIEGRKIRVDHSTPTVDPSRSVFVGNLPYGADESTLLEHFEKGCVLEPGDVVGVRIVRDKETFRCKGFGYVLFREKNTIPTALKLHESTYMKKKLRVMVCGKRFKGRKGEAAKPKNPKPEQAEKEKVTVGAFRRIIAKQQKEASGTNKRKRGEKKKNVTVVKAGAGNVSRRAALDKKVDKKVKKLQKRMSKGMGKNKR
eukprot:jgi/Psemu1/326878/estExt_fgenesh1_pg.C_4850002